MTYLSADDVRRLVLQTVQTYAVPRDEFTALQDVVHARLCILTVADRQTLAQVLLGLVELRPGVWVAAAELLALAPLAPGAAGEELRKVYARFAGHKEPAQALGWCLKRCTGVPVGRLYLQRVDPDKPSESAMVRVAGF